MWGERILVISETGELAIVDPGQGAPRVLGFTSQPVLPAPCYSMPALASGCLVLRSTTELVCLGK